MSSSWFTRYLYVASFNAFLAVIWTILYAIHDLKMPRIMAGGWPGTWLFVGYVLFIIIGCPGFALCGIVTHLIEEITGKTLNETLTRIHIVLTEIGLIGATTLLGMAGYVGGVMALEEQSYEAIHGAIIGYAFPITILLIIGAVGVLLTLANLWMTFSKKPAGD